MQHRIIHCAIVLALCSPAITWAATDSDASEEAMRQLDTTTVIGTRTLRQSNEVPSTVSKITRGSMDREQSRNLRDVLRYEAGVSINRNYGRFGLGSIRIRGLGGNRVQMHVDGVDVADTFSIGSFSNANRNFIDPELLESVELLRGPASALYGSDALGGVVGFKTRLPEHFLKPNESWAGQGKLHWDSANTESGASALLAGASGAWSGLIQVNGRQGHEMTNQGTNRMPNNSRTAPNPQDSEHQGMLVKLVHDGDMGHRAVLTIDGTNSETDSNVLSSVGRRAIFGRPINTPSLTAEDMQQRMRVQLGMEGEDIQWGFTDRYDVNVYWQNSKTKQRTFERRDYLAGGRPVRRQLRERIFRFDQATFGVNALFGKRIDAGATHEFTYGLNYKQADFEEMRTGRMTDLVTGSVSNSIYPDVFPVRDFPKSKTTELGVFVQDEIRLADGRLGIIPAIRWDQYKLTPTLDSIFAEDNPGIVPTKLSISHVSPKLGVFWKLTDDWSVFGQYSQGFRAPPYNDANIGFTNFRAGYAALPNPDLREETSKGFEAGIKYAGDMGMLSLSAYKNDYDDFIDSLRFVGMNADTGVAEFQSQNISEVSIKGVEFQGTLYGDAWGMDGWYSRFAFAKSEGDDKTSDQPLRSVDPSTLVLGMGYENDDMNIELVGTFVDRKDRVSDISRGRGQTAPAFAPPSYGVLDLLTQFHVGDHGKLAFGVYNITDAKYWAWSDVPLITNAYSLRDRYTNPGINVRFSYTHRF